MSLQPLSERSLRRLNRETGMEFVAARVSSNYTAVAVTADHVHYVIDRRTHAVTRQEEPNCHWTSCKERFPA